MTLQWQKAIDALDSAINSETQSSTKGYLLQVKAKFTNFIDQARAQQILLSAKSLNISTISPIIGIRYDKAINNIDQAKAVCDYIASQNITQNNYVIHVDAIASSLAFSQDSDGFENALQSIGRLIGFVSTRPDKETCGEGPDNLWATGGNNYFVIECKSAAVSTTISKDYCNQLGGSMRWFADEYGAAYGSVPIMVHRTNVVDRQATAVPNMRIITPEKLEDFKRKIKEFAIAVSQNDNWRDEGKIDSLLTHYKLRHNNIIERFTLPYRDV